MKKTQSPFSSLAGESLPAAFPTLHALPRRAQSFPLLTPSSVPFSWEHEPGIPKNPRNPDTHLPDPDRIPLPPPIRFHSKKQQPEADPFAAALAECAKEPPAADPELEKFLRRRSSVQRKRWSAPAGWFPGGGLGLLGLYGSCKAAAAACSVVESTIRAPRTRSVNRRPG